MKKGKRFQEIVKNVDKTKFYTPEEAIKLVKSNANAKFDETIDLVINLNVDTKLSDQQLRGAVVMPHGTGKNKRVLVIAKGEDAKAAEKAGADYVGDEEMIDKIVNENWFAYDVIVATPDMMPALGKVGKVLGPKGLMPNPKTGTVTTEVAKSVTEIKKGRVEYRTDKFGNIHVGIGKASFSEKDLLENMRYFVQIIIKERPTTIKGNFIKNITVSSTMGPGVKIIKNSFDK